MVGGTAFVWSVGTTTVIQMMILMMVVMIVKAECGARFVL